MDQSKLNRLSETFELIENAFLRAAATDLFALGCWLHSRGDHRVGAKMCTTALRAATLEQTDFESWVRKSLERGLEAQLVAQALPHAELSMFLRANMDDFAEVVPS